MPTGIGEIPHPPLTVRRPDYFPVLPRLAEQPAGWLRTGPPPRSRAASTDPVSTARSPSTKAPVPRHVTSAARMTTPTSTRGRGRWIQSCGWRGGSVALALRESGAGPFSSGWNSDGEGEFGERGGEAMSGIGVDAEFVVAAAQILDERMTGVDHPGRAEPFQPAHRPQP